MKTTTSHLNWMLTAVPAVSNGQVVSPCHSIANTAHPEFSLSSAFDGVNVLVGIRADASTPDTMGSWLLSPMETKVGSFISTGRQQMRPNARTDRELACTPWSVAT